MKQFKIPPLHISLTVSTALITGLFLFTLNTTGEMNRLLLSEHGIIESLSAFLWFCVAFCFVFFAPKQAFVSYISFTVLSLIFGLRELDFDKKFTEIGIFKINFYQSDTIHIMEKLIALAVVLTIIWLVFSLIRLFFRHYAEVGFSKNHFLALGVVSCLVMAKLFDGAARKLGTFDITLNERHISTLLALEETLELYGPLLMLIGVIHHFTSRLSHHPH